MNSILREAFDFEMDRALSLMAEKEFSESFSCLERAHILGQNFVWPHTLSHLYMLKVGILKRDWKEVIGQLFRLPLGLLGSFVGIVPTGNTGGSNVSAFIKMDIPEDLREIMKQ